MFKPRRRAGAAAAGSDLPYCSMCQQAIRVDAVTGRCALGHRAVAPSAVLGAEPVSQVAEAPVVTDPVLGDPAPGFERDPYATIVYGRSEYDYTTETFADPVTWDTPAPASAPDSPVDGALDDYVTWGEPTDGFSALDMDTEQLPVATESAPASPSPATETPVASDLLDELDDATYARRRAVGTVGASIAVSGAVFAAIAALPL